MCFSYCSAIDLAVSIPPFLRAYLRHAVSGDFEIAEGTGVKAIMMGIVDGGEGLPDRVLKKYSMPWWDETEYARLSFADLLAGWKEHQESSLPYHDPTAFPHFNPTMHELSRDSLQEAVQIAQSGHELIGRDLRATRESMNEVRNAICQLEEWSRTRAGEIKQAGPADLSCSS